MPEMHRCGVTLDLLCAHCCIQCLHARRTLMSEMHCTAPAEQAFDRANSRVGKLEVTDSIKRRLRTAQWRVAETCGCRSDACRLWIGRRLVAHDDGGITNTRALTEAHVPVCGVGREEHEVCARVTQRLDIR